MGQEAKIIFCIVMAMKSKHISTRKTCCLSFSLSNEVQHVEYTWKWLGAVYVKLARVKLSTK